MMQDLKLIIAKNIQKLRQGKGMTQVELAERLNYSDKSVSKWERGESLPDIGVLKRVADLFQVSLDYLVTEEHGGRAYPSAEGGREKKKKKHRIITATSMGLVFIVATLIFCILAMTLPDKGYPWLAYAYGVPAALVVWLVFNSLWFVPRRNYFIASLLAWSLLTALYLTFLAAGYSIQPILWLGIPVQLIILMWSRLNRPEEEPTSPPLTYPED